MDEYYDKSTYLAIAIFLLVLGFLSYMFVNAAINMNKEIDFCEDNNGIYTEDDKCIIIKDGIGYAYGIAKIDGKIILYKHE